MLRRLFVVIAVCAGACNSDVYLRDGVTDGDTFYVAPIALVDDDPVLQSWVAYSLMTSACQLQIGGENPARSTSFECERKARIALLDSWAEEQAILEGLSDDYLDTLASVDAAGFLDEYVMHYLHRPGWQPPANLDMRDFRTWRRARLRGHHAETRLIGYWGWSENTLEPDD